MEVGWRRGGNKREVKVYSFYIVIKIVSIIMIKIIHAKGYRCLETALVFN